MNINMKAYMNLSYGVYALTTLNGDKPTGCIANSAMQVTVEPGSIAVSVNHDNFTHSCIEKNGMFALSILPEDIDPKAIGTLGFTCGKDLDKFANIEYEIVDGMPVIKQSTGYFICKVINKCETVTHTVFLGEVLSCDVLYDGVPMTYKYYHEVVKGKAPKNAPTYIPDKYLEDVDMTKVKHICSVCSYVYDGETPYDELPDDYVCPICGMGKEVFEEVLPKKPADKHICSVCSYVYDGEIPFDELPEDYVCPICGMGKEVFEFK